VLLNGSNQNGLGDTSSDRGWYEVDSDQIYYYTTSPAQHGRAKNVKNTNTDLDAFV
jgi:hypothetical protein